MNAPVKISMDTAVGAPMNVLAIQVQAPTGRIRLVDVRRRK